MAFRLAERFRAVAAIDAPPAGPLPETDPLEHKAFFVAKAGQSRFAAEVEQSIVRLREKKHPVTVKDLGGPSRDLDAAELAELARWIDALDRI